MSDKFNTMNAPVRLEVSCLRGERLTGIGRYAFELNKALGRQLGSGGVEGIVPLKYWLKYERRFKELGIKASPYFLGSGAFYTGIVHGLDFKLPYSPRAGRVVTVHDMAVFEDEMLDRPFAEAGRRKFETMLRQSKPHALIAVSDFVAQRLGHFFPDQAEKIHLVKHGAEHIKSSAISNNPGEPVILCLGTLERRKNQITLVRAFNLIADTHKAARLVLVGQDGFGAELVHREVVHSPFADRIRIAGFLPESEMEALLASATIMVYPSVYEGFGIPILEAMAAGKPLITSDFGAMKEVAGDAALLCDTRSAEALAKGIDALLSSEQRRADLIKKGRSRLLQFSWKKAAQETVEVYGKVMELLR